MCKNVKKMCAKPRLPNLQIVEDVLQNEFGSWVLDINRDQVAKVYAESCMIRRAKELFGGDSEKIPHMVLVEKTLVNEFGREVWETQCKQVPRAINVCKHLIGVETNITFFA